jgi:hypothetical protein
MWDYFDAKEAESEKQKSSAQPKITQSIQTPTNRYLSTPKLSVDTPKPKNDTDFGFG